MIRNHPRSKTDELTSYHNITAHCTRGARKWFPSLYSLPFPHQHSHFPLNSQVSSHIIPIWPFPFPSKPLTTNSHSPSVPIDETNRTQCYSHYLKLHSSHSNRIPTGPVLSTLQSAQHHAVKVLCQPWFNCEQHQCLVPFSGQTELARGCERIYISEKEATSQRAR